ncbi:hypothetical protein ACQFYA_21195 [Promicromonospora sp. Marseille-Q5078]
MDEHEHEHEHHPRTLMRRRQRTAQQCQDIVDEVRATLDRRRRQGIVGDDDAALALRGIAAAIRVHSPHASTYELERVRDPDRSYMNLSEIDGTQVCEHIAAGLEDDVDTFVSDLDPYDFPAYGAPRDMPWWTDDPSDYRLVTIDVDGALAWVPAPSTPQQRAARLLRVYTALFGHDVGTAATTADIIIDLQRARSAATSQGRTSTT